MDEPNEEKTCEIIVKQAPFEKDHVFYKETSKFPGVSLFSTPAVDCQRYDNTISFKFPHPIYTCIRNSFKQSSLGTLPVCPLWLSPFQRYKHLDMCHGSWEDTWIPGCVCLSLFGIPRGVSKDDLLQTIKAIPLPLKLSLNNFSITILFGDEFHAFNFLPITKTIPGGETLALAHFSNTESAHKFWCLCNSGIFKVYGHCLNCYPDPSGYRILGEAVIQNVSNELLKPLQDCHCCESSNNHMTENLKNFFLILPFVTHSFFKDKLVPIFDKKLVNVKWLSCTLSALLTFPDKSVSTLYCLPQRYQFKTNHSNQIIHAGLFSLGHLITPCIFNPCQTSLYKTKENINVSRSVFATSKKRLPTTPKILPTSPSITQDMSLNTIEALKGNEQKDKFKVPIACKKDTFHEATKINDATTQRGVGIQNVNTFTKAPATKRPRGRPKGSTKKTLQ